MRTPFAHTAFTRISTAFVIAIAPGCADRPSPVAPTFTPLAEIVDAVHNSGNARFYFLPPLVPSPITTGTPDLALSPLVSVCEWNGTGCGATIAQFPAPVSGDHYHANWRTDQCAWGACTLDESEVYRLSVAVGSLALGHIDLRVYSGQGKAKNLETGEFIAIQEGRTLPVAFRIEHGIVASLTITPNPAVVARGSGLQLTVSAIDLHGNAVSSPVVAWSIASPAVAAVSSDGLLTGVESGCTTVSATLGGLQASANVRVTPLDPDMVFVDREPMAGFPFFGNYRLFAGRTDGCIERLQITNDTPLDNEQFVPAISPDGRFVAYIEQASDENSLRIARMDGSGEIIVNTPGMRPNSPSWSHDGTRLAFGAWMTGGVSGSEIWVVNADGSGLHRVVGPVQSGVFINNVRWSPSAGIIAFNRLPGSGVHLNVVSASGGTPTVIASGGATGPQNFEWSPDGSVIAYRRGDYAVALVNPDGSNLRVLAGATAYSRHSLAWSPDGSRIALGSGSCGFTSIEIVSVSSGASTTAACAGSTQHYIEWSSASIAWSRDGNEVLYGRWRELIAGTAMFNVEAARFDGTGTRVVTTGRVPVVRR